MSSALRGLAPREGLDLGLMKTGRTGLLVSHAAGRRQTGLGTPVPRTPTYGGCFEEGKWWVYGTGESCVPQERLAMVEV